MKQRYSLRSNAVKFRAIALVMIALVMGGNVVWGQNWNPTQSGFSNYDTFYLRTNNPGSTNFEVSTTGEEGSYSGSFSSIGTGITVPAGKHYVIHFRNDTTILMNGQFYLNYDNSSVTLILDAECNAHSDTNPTLRIKGVTGYQNGQQIVVMR